MPITKPLTTIFEGTSSEAIEGILQVNFPDAQTILDTTWGFGGFWKGSVRHPVGIDLDPKRAKDVVANFEHLPFKDNSFDVVVFDPPFQSDMGRGKVSVMGGRFKTYDSLASLEASVVLGSQEAWRVARLGVIVKCQSYIHASRLVHMARWIEDAMPSPLYDELHIWKRGKLIDPKWGDQLSIYRTHSTFLMFRKDGPVHKRRRPKIPMQTVRPL